MRTRTYNAQMWEQGYPCSPLTVQSISARTSRAIKMLKWMTDGVIIATPAQVRQYRRTWDWE